MAVLTKGQTVVAGLGVYTLTTSVTGLHSVTVATQENQPSGITITIAQSGSTSVSVTSAAPSATQTHIDLQEWLNIVTGDVITVTIASSSPIDNQLNTVKSIINIHTGLS